jgi:thiamine kinase-like enzyme
MRNSASFKVPARWPTHGDLYEGNTLVSKTGGWYVLDWDGLALGDPVADYIKVLWSVHHRAPAFDWKSLGVDVTDDGFDARIGFYVREALLDDLVDGLAEHVAINPLDPVLASIRNEKYEAFEGGLRLYRERYG